MSASFTVPVTLVARVKTGTNADGNDIYTPTSTSTAAGLFDPGGSTETTQGGDTVITQPTVYLPLPAPAAIDQVTVNGLNFEVDGDPAVWSANGFTGRQAAFPVVVKLRKVAG